MSVHVGSCRVVSVRVSSCLFVSVQVGSGLFVLVLYPQRLVMDSKSRLINFPGVFVMKKKDMDEYVIFIAFCYPKSEKAHKNHNHR